jgi:uncharacterized protein (TIGR00255 family)
MALVSMTGFGRSRGRLSDRFGASVVVRSVNHRYLDIQIRTNLREEAPEVEAVVRSVASDRFQRGRVTAQLNLERHNAAPVGVVVNVEAVRDILEQLARIEMPENTTGSIGLGDVLTVPGLVSVTAPETIFDDDELSALKKVTAEAVCEAVEMRVAEGARLGRQIESELAELTAFADWFEPRMPDMRQRILERTKERVEALMGSASAAVDPERVVQEAALIADRADVAEEVVRLRSHLEAFSGRLRSGGTIGRTLDFLCQEIHRELNTLGSKCRELGVAERIIEAKAATERVREQVQNLE